MNLGRFVNPASAFRKATCRATACRLNFPCISFFICISPLFKWDIFLYPLLCIDEFLSLQSAVNCVPSSSLWSNNVQAPVTVFSKKKLWDDFNLAHILSLQGHILWLIAVNRSQPVWNFGFFCVCQNVFSWLVT